MALDTLELSVYRGRRFLVQIPMFDADNGDAPIILTGRTYRSFIATTAAQNPTTTRFVCTVLSPPNAHVLQLELPAAHAALLTGTAYVADLEETIPAQDPEIILKMTISVSDPVTEGPDPAP